VKKSFQTAVCSITVVTLAALCLRLYLLLDYVTHHPRLALGAIPFLFEPGNIAWSLFNGHGFASPFRIETGPTAWMTPVWPMFLAGVFRIFGPYTFRAFLVTAMANIGFSTLVCVPLFFTGKRMAGRGAGAGAGWLWAIFPVAAVLPFESLWEGSLAALLAATVVWATSAIAGSARIRNWVAYGLLWGATLLTSAAFLALFPLILGWLAWRRTQTRKQVGLAGAVALLCCVPWTIRNLAAFHAFVPLRSVMGLSLWVGNNDQADGLTPNRHPISNTAERVKYQQQGEIAYMRDKERDAIRFMLSHPGRELRLTRDRFLAFWSGGTPHPLSDVLRARSNWFRYVVLFNLAAAIGAVAGIVILYRRRDALIWPLAMFPLIFPLPYYLTVALPRYRLPIDPVLLLLTAFALQAICQTVSRGSTPPRGSSRNTSS
jgi:4-amino-4-deoxy-L-arabinose transferase-like glycosyltransferase